MTRLAVELDGRRYTIDGEPADIAIPVDFDGLQPGFYGASPATARPMHSGSFIGDTRLGGSCNAAHVSLIAHCNGTHTECVGHITDERVSIHRLATAPLYTCTLVSVEAQAASDSDEHGGLASAGGDLLITREALTAAVTTLDTAALAIRTLPNPESKRTRAYEAGTTPYFTVEAMQWIVGQGIEHLLVDTPSVDRLDDGGRLTAHRVFWGLTHGHRSVNDASRPAATITELIYVPDAVRDGKYLLGLQVAPFVSDAAPSRPLLHALIP